MRYHAKRRDFFQMLHNVNVWLVAVSGGGTALSSFVDNPRLTQILGVIVFLLAAADRTLGFSKKARLHAELYGQFSVLAAKIIQVRTPTDKQLRALAVVRTNIERKEPSALVVLNIMCRNEEALARGAPQYIVPLRFHQRALAQLVSLPPRSWESHRR